MPAYDFRAPRLYVDSPLADGIDVALEREQAHYLLNVLRLSAGDRILAFNGRDGEWLCEIAQASKKAASLSPREQTRSQPPARDLHYLFAPLKQARLDYMVQKATEMGASLLGPVLTQHTQVTRVNLERMRANAIEAAEQCGTLSVPDVVEPLTLNAFIAARDAARLLIFCDEAAEIADPVEALKAVRRPGQPLAIIIGPEGGFSEGERASLLKLPNVVRIALGPRILRADTAAVAALTLVQAVLGDWV
ncbi:ribosomal RNA small subunit methyltransferase E [Variibacter gotjawalensis]|uniref:Ribosomal RNA small subunit methyltransferase E n=1 Tax=Variibacter gotjawalensis TaxID=1333996 RepID=A0A0S3PPT0_9BRAD|nr:16S rRNA (uracil(1498)-N(3))-methyltransferase [Variibacter gotjawalensis]NIK48169.1 16S rRNA (uracil1498-N3)-methyltransferase [Variibacter gotjawalensis]RZS50041.1 16S rRNA (uracil1498-N3)-methyltransferase [Variibacter gotjawalensis]BAT57872.1 ribosomal RNA small subunit methyltransferase E [Variibacter gotjawalensis]